MRAPNPSAASDMDGFSVTSLTSLCSSIVNRAASSTGELERLGATHLGAARPSPVFALAGHLREINRVAAQLEQTLGGAAVISPQLQHVLDQALTAADGTTGRLHKQVMRLQADNVAFVNGYFAQVHGDLLETYSQLFAYFCDVLSCNDRAEQDARLNAADGQELLEKASVALDVASQENSILLDDSKSSDPSSQPFSPDTKLGDQVPPPYDAVPAYSITNHQPQAGPSSGGGGLFSFARSIKSFAANLGTHKSDPLASALCQAVLGGDTRLVSGLLAQGASASGRDEGGRTPLQCVIADDRDDAARLLLAAGASVKGSGGRSGTPPLFLAARAGSLRVAQVLLEHGAKVDEKSASGEPYFVGVCDSGNLAGIEFLLRNGAKATWKSVSGRPVLVQAALEGNNELAELLLAHGAKATCKNVSGRPVLVEAILKENVELTELLLVHGANANCSDITGSSVLSLATEKPDLALARLLVAHGANANADTIYGTSLLAGALSHGQLDAARLLLEHGAKGAKPDLDGQPLLVRVILDESMTGPHKLEMARRLLESGASASARDVAWSRPAICHALEAGGAGMAELLLAYGATPKGKMSSGTTLLTYAVNHGMRGDVAALIHYGADVNEADEQGRTPLRQAVLRQDADVVKLLKEHGADVENLGASGVVDLARALNEAHMMELLGLTPSARGADANALGGSRVMDLARALNEPQMMEALELGPSRPGEGSGAGAQDAGQPGRPETPPPGYDLAMKS